MKRQSKWQPRHINLNRHFSKTVSPDGIKITLLCRYVTNIASGPDYCKLWVINQSGVIKKTDMLGWIGEPSYSSDGENTLNIKLAPNE